MLGDSNGDIRILSSLTFQIPTELSYFKEGFKLNHKKAIITLCCDLTEKVLVSICSQNIVNFWSLNTGIKLKKIILGKEQMNIVSVFFLVKNFFIYLI